MKRLSRTRICRAKGMRIHDHGREPGPGQAAKEIILRRHRKGAMQAPQRQRREQAKRVEMAGMVRHQNE